MLFATKKYTIDLSWDYYKNHSGRLPMGATLDEIVDSLQKGQSKRVTELVKIALEEGISSRKILEEGFLRGMEQLSTQFDEEEVGIPRILSVTRALDKGVEALHHYNGRREVKEIGTVVLGTVNGELHDIGKNLVRLMMESRNIQVIDLGVNVSPGRFVNEVSASKAKVLVLSGILPTSDRDMKAVIEEFELRGIRDKVYIMVGGYYMNADTARRIGADCYTDDAGTCADTACRYLTKKNRRKKKNLIEDFES